MFPLCDLLSSRARLAACVFGFVTLLGGLPAVADSLSDSLIYEARFNDSSNLELWEGATLGGPGSGVSSVPADQSYFNGIALQPGEAGPGAVLTGEARIEPHELQEFTITGWYKPLSEQRDGIELFSGFANLLMWDARHQQWNLRVLAQFADDGRHNYFFGSGSRPPMKSWMIPGEWTFIAMTWTRASGTVTFYQAGVNAPVVNAASGTRKDPVQELTEGPRPRRVVGNDSGKRERSFVGNIDDFRVFAKALDAEALEKIRQADLKNQSIAVP